MIKMKTRMAANLLCQPTNSAKAANTNTTIPISMAPLVFLRTAVEEQQDILGPDPWQYGLTDANRKNLETIQRYVHQQGMVSKLRPLEQLFDDTDLGDSAGLEEV